MNFSELIKKIQESGIDGAGTLAKDVNSYVQELTETNKQTVSKLNSQIENLTTAIGIETGTTEERIGAAKNNLSKLTAERDQLKTDNSELQNKITQTDKKILINSAARAAGASPEVLAAIVNDEKLEVNGDSVTVNGEPLSEWANKNKSPFVPSLFPSSDKTGNSLPSSPPHQSTPKTETTNKTTSEEQTQSIADSYFGKNYKAPSFAIQ